MASPPLPRPPWGAYLALGASMALVGSYVGLSKLLLAVFPVFLLAWLRFGIAALAMLPWLKAAPGAAPLGAAQRRLLFWQSFLGNFLFSICMLFGVQHSSAVAAGVVMSAIPAAVALLSWAWLGERVGGRGLAALGCAVLGMALLAFTRAPADPLAPASGLGHALLLAAVFCEASYVVIGKKLASQVPAHRVSALINLWGLALVTPLGLWQAWTFDFSAVPGRMWALLSFYALAASVATVWLWMKGLKHVPAARAGVFTVLLPVSAAGVGVGLLGEPFGALHGLALALALAGLLLATWPAKAAPAPSAG